eukprot:5520014-Pleurochrysis_carterae.AAC.1
MSGAAHGMGRRPSAAMTCRSGTTDATRSARKNATSGSDAGCSSGASVGPVRRRPPGVSGSTLRAISSAVMRRQLSHHLKLVAWR